MSIQLQHLDIVYPPHSRYTFKLLAADTFTYALENIGCLWVWNPPEEVKSITKPVFQSELGDAVILFMDRHKKKPGVFNWDHEVYIDTLEDLMEYIDEVLQDKFLRDDCFLMDVFRILAFFVDLVTRFYMDDNYHLIEPALNCLDVIYMLHFRRPLLIVGGYHALFQFSKQYVEYNSTCTESPIDVTAAVGSCPMAVDKDCTITMDVDTKEFDLKETKTHCAGGSAKSLTPIKCNSKTKEILTQIMTNEFSSPHSEHCSSGFKIPKLNKSETKTNADHGSAKPFTPIKFNSEIKEMSNQALKNEFWSSHSEHCPFEYNGALDLTDTKPILKTNNLKRRLSFCG